MDWYGYSASVSTYILEQFEKEVGYPFRPEYIIDQGYMNNQYRIPSKEFQDFQAFQRREVAKLAKELVDITHEMGKEAMMFLGDHWIGMEPFMDEFKGIGLDAVVCFPRRGRPGKRGKGELGDGAACDFAETGGPYRIRRLSEAGTSISGFRGLCGERLQGVPDAV